MSTDFGRLEEVRGLRGLIALSRKDGSLFYHSPALDPSSCAEVTMRMRKLISSAPVLISRVNINLEGSSLLVSSFGEAILVLHTETQFKTEELRIRLLEMSKASPPAVQEQAAPKVSEEECLLLLRAIEMVSKPVIEELGTFVAVNALKEARNQILSDHRCLTAFNLEKDGRIALRTVPPTVRADAVAAVAAWIATFYRHCNGVVPAFPPEMVSSLLSPIRVGLEKLNFFEAMRSATAK